MNKILKAVTILMVLLLCLSFTVGAAQSGETKVKTKGELVQDKIKAKDFVKYQQSHDKNTFDREVAGPLDIKVQSIKNKVPQGFEPNPDGYQTMVSYKEKNKIHIRDTEHKIETVQIAWSELATLPGFDGEKVLITHLNDAGVKDAVWVQEVYNAGGYAYLEELPFSEIIVSGFTGTYTKADTNLDFSDILNIGYTFDSDYVNYINLTVEDQYATKTDPYDINTTGLVGWWRFDEGSGTNVSDSSGSGYHGTYTGANYTTGKYNDAGEFGISGDYVNTTYSINLSTPFTISFWIARNDSWDGSDRVFGNFDSYTGYDVLVSARNTDTLRFRYGVTGDGHVIECPLSNLDQLYNVVWTHNPSVASVDYSIYRDGILINSDTWGETKNVTEFFKIGRETLVADANIDDVQIYNLILTPDEIEQLYYIKTSQLKAKTNSNATYSDYWNSSTDNPLSIPYGVGESISSLIFDEPSSIVQNGITIYDPVNMLFNTSIEIGHLENTTNVYEEVNDDSYQIFIQHIPGVNSTSGTISFTSDANDILSSPYLTTGMDTSNTNAVMSYNAATREWTVTTGTITAGTTYNYVLFGVLEGEALADITTGGFGSDNMHAYTATANDTIITGSAFRATYGDTVWGNQSNDLWSNLGPLFILAAVILVVGVIVVSVRRFRE